MAILFPSGSVGQSGGEYIGQIVYNHDYTVRSYSENNSATGTHTVITSPSITPQNSNSRFLVFGMANGGTLNYHYYYEWGLKLYRTQSGNDGFVGGNSNTSHQKDTNVQMGCNSGSEQGNNSTFFYVDHPNNTNSLTYSLEFWGGETSTYYVNRCKSDSSYRFPNTGGTHITVMEVCTV